MHGEEPPWPPDHKSQRHSLNQAPLWTAPLARCSPWRVISMEMVPAFAGQAGIHSTASIQSAGAGEGQAGGEAGRPTVGFPCERA